MITTSIITSAWTAQLKLLCELLITFSLLSTPTTPNMAIRFTTLFLIRCTTTSSISRLISTSPVFENTLVKHIVEPKEIKYKWNNLTRSTMHLVRKEITNEDEGKMNWSHNGQKQVVIANKDAPNKYGEPKGYKIMPSRGGSGFVTHQYYVLKRKDSELRASNAWNDYDTEHPMVDFSKYLMEKTSSRRTLSCTST
ncbi:hypothetical protein CNBG_2133 [Cryptococcus deuterogattii R265]|uniref:uncharacterized protein n=1 Tax=Cryptococcus deuterogattii (strain R265) TaxID=294750 RepID=UPI001935F5BB|nr:hypothetical protein CNBG_2133 [Cryptococcus deuterogattii R265]